MKKRKKWIPKFELMKEKDIFRIKKYGTFLSGFNEKGQLIYYENEDRAEKRTYHENGNIKTIETGNGYIEKMRKNKFFDYEQYENGDYIKVLGENKIMIYENGEFRITDEFPD